MTLKSSFAVLFLIFIFFQCIDQPKDCLGVEGGLATKDNCGNCDDDPSNDCLQDCSGIWGGLATQDNCGNCDDDPSNDCTQDCMGVWGGSGNDTLNFCGHCEDNFNCDFLGYMNKLSFFPGEIADLYISSRDTILNADLGIFDINGNTVGNFSTSIYPQTIENQEPWKNGFGFNKTIDFDIPYIKSGIYFIAENFGNNIYKNKIPFIIKATEPVDAIIIYPSNTGNAYNSYGGRSLYTNPRALEVSAMRPQYLRHFSIPFLRWMETESYNIGYVTDYDIENEDNLGYTNLVIIPGHSEYWSRNARQNFDNFIDQGNDAIILSGNNMWWQVRYSADGKSMICYKSDDDPIENPFLQTIHWYKPSLDYSILQSIGADYYHGGSGKNNNYGWDGFKIVKPNSPLFQGCDLVLGQIIHMPHVELDSAPISHFSSEGVPVIDTSKLDFFKTELLAYDLVSGYESGQEKPGTFIVIQKSETSGVIINTSSTNWCKEGFTGVDNSLVETITRNMVELLLNNTSVFSD